MELERSGDTDHLRISDREREQVAELLGQAAAEGRLTLDEYTDRVGSVYAARTRGELAPLLHDLPVAVPPPLVGYAAKDVSYPAPGPASERLVAVFAAEDRKGVWRVPATLEVWTVFGDCVVELQDAQLQHEVTTIEANVIFGAVTVYVPEGMDVRLTGTAIFGDKASKMREPPRPGAPVIEVRSRVLFGSVLVRPPKRKRSIGR